MYNNRQLQVIAVAVVLMAVATNGVAAASAPAGPERNVASSHCPAILRQELGTVMPSAWSGYQKLAILRQELGTVMPRARSAYQELAILRQELGTVLPAGWSEYRESDCMTGGRLARLATAAPVLDETLEQ